ncbi:unnamed protein product [Trifolium pratense]|uniref:Uncharacterized protein n=1 Tax=Trifolium pratense TaxID=57577 RepID=A0ACB0JK89_TRIPR|nr:unnamed protein product [Trifolium pratense]
MDKSISNDSLLSPFSLPPSPLLAFLPNSTHSAQTTRKIRANPEVRVRQPRCAAAMKDEIHDQNVLPHLSPLIISFGLQFYFSSSFVISLSPIFSLFFYYFLIQLHLEHVSLR